MDDGDFEVSYEHEVMQDILESNEDSTTEMFDPLICPTSIHTPDSFTDFLTSIESGHMFDQLITTSIETFSKVINSNGENSEFDNIQYLIKPKLQIDRELLSWLDQKERIDSSLLTPTSTWNDIPSDTRIQIVSDAMTLPNRKYYDMSNKDTIVSDLHSRPTITEVSKYFTLTAKQHACFTIVALSLLRGWQNREINKEISDRDFIEFTKQNQNLIFLTGEGGTGKSRIIDSIEYFCKKWGRSDALAKTALTGKASFGINGIYFNLCYKSFYKIMNF
jgi:hypothetical protein